MATQPIFLLSDSQLLFARDEDGTPHLERVKQLLPNDQGERCAAYLGASNGDAPEFYDLFQSAFADFGFSRTQHIQTNPSKTDREYLARCDLILLAGGDTRRGLDAFKQSGVDDVIRKRYHEGAVLMGVSAGAIQLGLYGWEPQTSDESPITTFEGLRLVPNIVSVHEPEPWPTLHQLVKTQGTFQTGIGLPAGSGLIYHPDHRFEPWGRPIVEVSNVTGDLKNYILFPGDEDQDPPQADGAATADNPSVQTNSSAKTPATLEEPDRPVLEPDQIIMPHRMVPGSNANN